MPWGDPLLAKWGQLKWGQQPLGHKVRFFGDFIAEKTFTRRFFGDVVGQKTFTDRFFGDIVAQATLTRRFEADIFAARLPHEFFSGQRIEPIVLVELFFPSGTVRVAPRTLTRAGFGWSPLLVGATDILQVLGGPQGDVRLTLDGTGGAGPVFRDVFTDAQSPESSEVIIYLLALEDPDEILFEVFRGRVEQVVDMSRERVMLEVVRADVILDRVIGRPLDTTIAPNAPNESLGQTIPIVFGKVENHRGLISDSNAISFLRENVDAADAVLLIQDASEFPETGQADIDDEVVAWTGKTGNELTGVTRGEEGTRADEHQVGAEVTVRGTFEVTFADHAVTSIEDIRILTPEGNLAIPEPTPTVDAANGKVTWPQTPRFGSPLKATQFLRAGFDAVGGANTADDPLRGSQDSGDYSDLNFASVPAGKVLELSRTATLLDLGDIVSVFAVCVHDPTGFGGAQIKVVIDGTEQVLGTLGPSDQIPDRIRRSDLKTLGVTHDVIDPTHRHVNQGIRIQGFQFFLEDNSGWVDPDNGFEGNTTAALTTSKSSSMIGKASPSDLSTILVEGEEAIGFRMRVTSGQGVPAGGSIAGAIVTFGNFGSITHNGGSAISEVRVPLTGFAPLPAGIGSDLSGAFLDARITPNLGIQIQQAVCRAVGFELQIQAGDTRVAGTDIAQNRAVAEMFDITDLVAGDPDFFTDPNRGGRLRVTNATDTLEVLNLFYVIEHQPSRQIIQELPTVLATVRGLEPAGAPTEILRRIITDPVPIGMGLTSNEIALGAHVRARQSLAGDAIRLDFAIRGEVAARQLIAEVCEQSDLRQWWEKGRHHVIRKPDPDALLATFKTLRDGDIVRGSIRFSRTGWHEVVNRLEIRYRPDMRHNGPSRIVTSEDATSQADFGLRTEQLTYPLIRDDVTAQLVADRRVSRAKRPRGMVRFDLPLFGLELRRGDLIGLLTLLVDATKAEVWALPLSTTGFMEVAVEAIVWEE